MNRYTRIGDFGPSLLFQDGVASHAEGMLDQVLAEYCPNVLDNGNARVCEGKKGGGCV